MKIEDLQDLGTMIKGTRKSQGITQANLAMAAGTSVRLIVELEAGIRGVQFDTVIKVCNLLGLNIDVR